MNIQGDRNKGAKIQRVEEKERIMGKGKHVFQDRRLDDLHRVRISIEAGKRTYIKKVLRPAPENSGRNISGSEGVWSECEDF